MLQHRFLLAQEYGNLQNMQLNFFESLKSKNFNPERRWLQGLNLKIIRRAWQRSINLRVKPNGQLFVTCSKTCPQKQVDDFLLSQKSWIDKSIAEFDELRARFPKKSFFPEETFLYRGQKLPLKINYESTRKKPSFYFAPDQLCFTHDPYDYSHEKLTELLRQVYKNKSVEFLKQMVVKVSEEMQLYPEKVSYRSQKTRWGSCSSEGHLSLNWKLIAAPDEVARYVVVHELAHLEFQDHSKHFWSLVHSFCPGYLLHKQWLYDNQYEFDFLAKTSEIH